MDETLCTEYKDEVLKNIDTPNKILKSSTFMSMQIE